MVKGPFSDTLTHNGPAFPSESLFSRVKRGVLYSRVFWAWCLLVPTLSVLAVVAGIPLYRTFYFSFTDATLLSLDVAPEFVGFTNFLQVLQDPEWWLAVRNTLMFTVVSVSLETLMGLGVALLLHSAFPGRGLVRAAVLIPWAIPTVNSAKMWSWMFHDLYGVVNRILLDLNIISTPIAWLSGGWPSFSALVLVDVWKTTPFMALLILAGLQMISKEVYEASRIDCKSSVRTFFLITLPLLRPTLVVAIIFRSLDALRIFDLVYVLMGNNSSTATMAVYARQRLMEFQEFGYGSAVSVVIFLFIAGLTILYLRLIRPAQESN